MDRRSRKAELTRACLIDAARRLVAAHGPDAVFERMVCRRPLPRLPEPSDLSPAPARTEAS